MQGTYTRFSHLFLNFRIKKVWEKIVSTLHTPHSVAEDDNGVMKSLHCTLHTLHSPGAPGKRHGHSTRRGEQKQNDQAVHQLLGRFAWQSIINHRMDGRIYHLHHRPQRAPQRCRGTVYRRGHCSCDTRALTGHTRFPAARGQVGRSSTPRAGT